MCYRETKQRSRVGLPPSPADVKEQPTNLEALSNALNDFCAILTWNIRCIRIHVARVSQTSSFSISRENSFSNIFPRQGAPMRLSTALTEDKLSVRHKILLAFTISKAFWQYYDSHWMRFEWSLETIQLLQTSNRDSEAPFLEVRSTGPEDWMYRNKESVGTPMDVQHLHPFPYILNLGLLLVQLGSITPEKKTITADSTHSTSAQRNNDLYVSCCLELIDSAWPAIKIPNEHKSRYRRIVEECLPTQSEVPKPLFGEHLDAVGRRLALKEYVVRPLFELLQDRRSVEDTDGISYCDGDARA